MEHKWDSPETHPPKCRINGEYFNHGWYATTLLYDADHPAPYLRHTGSPYLMYMKSNIPVDEPVEGEVQDEPRELMSYEPPVETPLKHRYYVVVAQHKQPLGIQTLLGDDERKSFPVSKFLEKHDMQQVARFYFFR